MVRPDRFELPTYWFVASCSIQLSYGRTCEAIPNISIRLMAGKELERILERIYATGAGLSRPPPLPASHLIVKTYALGALSTTRKFFSSK